MNLLTYEAQDKFLQSDGLQFIYDINKEIGNKGWAYVLSPGINSGFEFEGDGSYIIN